MTRAVYRSTEDADSSLQSMKKKRNKSFNVLRPEPESETENANSILQPGGFRRDYLRRRAPSPSVLQNGSSSDSTAIQEGIVQPRQSFLTRNFLEFLSIYGHFAGEDLLNDDETRRLRPQVHGGASGHANGHADGGEDFDAQDPTETTPLLNPDTPEGQRALLVEPEASGESQDSSREPSIPGTKSTWGTVGILIKSFVGTGVLFLPRAFLNGGMIFSGVVLLTVSALSFYCFMLLVNTRLKVQTPSSFGDLGGHFYGKWLRLLIQSSVALSQIGFVSAYIVFTSENMQAFIVAVSKCKVIIDIKWIVLIQVAVLLPFSLFRNLARLGFAAVVADVFIFLGIFVLYGYDISAITANHGISDVAAFNPNSWSLFIGTAIFTFEGVGLIIPIQEAMKTPTKFGPVLAGVMIFITIIFLVMGALSYAAFGSKTETVLFLNLPQDDKVVNGVQFIYSVAILLSTPLQLFPAIAIMEKGFFSSSGKDNRRVKWQKNVLRFFVVFACALIAWGGAGDLDKFVALVGSFACIPLVYIYPVCILS